MEIPKIYDSKQVEKKWSEFWIKNKTFAFKPGSKNFVIDHPPAFTSGTLHMGHILDYSWIDFAARYNRMKGFNTFLPIGFDCNGLPTEMKVESQFGIKKENKTEFLRKCKEFTNECVTKMSDQYKKLGYSCDWSSLYLTMNDDYKKMVQISMLKMFDEGLVYRASHPVPWCTKCRTALAKAEMGYIEKKGMLYYIKLKVEKNYLTIATTRPDMIPACVAVFIHPDDKKHKKFIGKKATLPVTHHEVPIMADKDVDMEFGSGVVYCCSYGDEEDIKHIKRYKLPERIIFSEDGKATYDKYKGLTIEQTKKKIIEDLKKENALVKTEELTHNVVCHTERAACKNPIQYLPLPQFFVKVKPFTKEIIANGKKMKWYPEFMRSHLIDWASSMDWDWIISRQRTFGTPIPFWYCEKCGELKKPDEKQLPIDVSNVKINEKCECGGTFRGATDVCDCWFDSSISPLFISKWGTDNGFFKKTYPNTARMQGFEIIRTWLFYTLFRCYRLTGKIPWELTVQHGNVLSPADGRKMSKSLNNAIDPEQAFEKYSADALRQWAATSSLGKDFLFSWKEIEHSKKFLAKLWNISRFIQMNVKQKPKPGKFNTIDKWILSRLNNLIRSVSNNLDNYTFNMPIHDIRNFLWHDFADYYLEMVKHRIDDNGVKYVLFETLYNSLKMLAVFVPFITEEIYQDYFRDYDKAKSIHISEFPKPNLKLIDKKSEEIGEMAKDVISAIRKFKNSNNMPMNAPLSNIIIDKKDLKPVLGDIKGTVKSNNMSIGKAKETETEVFKIGLLITV